MISEYRSDSKSVDFQENNFLKLYSFRKHYLYVNFNILCIYQVYTVSSRLIL